MPCCFLNGAEFLSNFTESFKNRAAYDSTSGLWSIPGDECKSPTKQTFRLDELIHIQFYCISKLT